MFAPSSSDQGRFQTSKKSLFGLENFELLDVVCATSGAVDQIGVSYHHGHGDVHDDGGGALGRDGHGVRVGMVARESVQDPTTSVNPPCQQPCMWHLCPPKTST